MIKKLAAFSLLAMLASNSLAHDAPSEMPDYDKAEWRGWLDVDGDCQNRRAEMLINHSLEPVTFTDGEECYVTTGKWIGPYSGKTFTEAKKLDIDHVIPLAEAHRSGGWKWPEDMKKAFSNDPENLLIVSASMNRSKGDKDPAQWFDKIQEAYRCTYLKKWISIKERYNLEYDDEEKAFIDTELKSCD